MYQIIEPKLKFNGSFRYENNPENVIIHHALSPKCTVNDVHKWHLAKKWMGIGYHYFISKKGQIFRGRPEKANGAHCKEQLMNLKSIGICLEGCYEDYTVSGKVLTEKNVPEEQLKALIWLVKNIQKRYNIPIGKVSPHHRYATYKSCPGTYFPWNNFIADLKKPEEAKVEKDYIYNKELEDAVLFLNQKGVLHGWKQDEKGVPLIIKPKENLTNERFYILLYRTLKIGGVE